MASSTIRPSDTGARDFSEFESGKRYYLAHKARLLAKYRGDYIAILGEKVVDHDGDFDALTERVFAGYGVQSLYMPLVGKSPRVVRLVRPAFVTSA